MEEKIIRYVLLTAFLVCATGLVVTVGASVAPWLGWAAGALVFGIPALVMVHKVSDDASVAKDRAAAGSVGERFSMSELEGP